MGERIHRMSRGLDEPADSGVPPDDPQSAGGAGDVAAETVEADGPSRRKARREVAEQDEDIGRRGLENCSDAAYQGVLHIAQELADEIRLGRARNHDLGMSDDALADYLEGFVDRSDGSALRGGGVGWFDSSMDITVVQRGRYSITAFRESSDDFNQRKA
ncbi:hypothetical protein [Polymorphospora sp. NPDC050346]|uniref:hypothetical protein n=1 Tax=Polymorphospora sp. NPDC050346 TaxID=3155780 RepID=UPI00340C6B1A